MKRVAVACLFLSACGDPPPSAEQLAQWQREDQQLFAERAAARAQVDSDIKACATVTDEVRCYQAFMCRHEPEDCVFQHGDIEIVIDRINADIVNEGPR